jgi:hypothetical protein
MPEKGARRAQKSHGLGRRRRVGVNGSTGVRLLAPVEGTEVTTSGSWRLFSIGLTVTADNFNQHLPIVRITGIATSP